MTNFYQRISFWLVFAVLAVSAGWAGHYHLFGAGCFRPVLVTEKRILDLGTVLPDSLTETEFFVTNGGVRPLRIEKVRSGCAGCVEIISYPKEPIRRNESMPVRIALNTKSLKGNVRKSLVIVSNDPLRPVYSILVDAVVARTKEEAAENAD